MAAHSDSIMGRSGTSFRRTTPVHEIPDQFFKNFLELPHTKSCELHAHTKSNIGIKGTHMQRQRRAALTKVGPTLIKVPASPRTCLHQDTLKSIGPTAHMFAGWCDSHSTPPSHPKHISSPQTFNNKVISHTIHHSYNTVELSTALITMWPHPSTPNSQWEIPYCTTPWTWDAMTPSNHHLHVRGNSYPILPIGQQTSNETPPPQIYPSCGLQAVGLLTK